MIFLLFYSSNKSMWEVNYTELGMKTLHIRYSPEPSLVFQTVAVCIGFPELTDSPVLLMAVKSMECQSTLEFPLQLATSQAAAFMN